MSHGHHSGSFRAAALWACLVACTVPASAGVWSDLPDAISRLQRSADDHSARRIMRAAEEVIIAEASDGRVATVAVLVEVYSGLVVSLADGDLRLERLEERVAGALVERGDVFVVQDPNAAGQLWSLAARLDPGSGALKRLRGLLLPPDEPEAGAVWKAAPDGAELVFHPELQFRMGCTASDRHCQRDERFFRWVTVAAFWMERTEVTKARYRLCVEAGACTAPRDVRGFRDPSKDSEPVVNVTWDQAQDFSAWAGRRLPSEAEWERAARGLDLNQRYPWGNRRLRERANLEGVMGVVDVYDGVAPVGVFEATGLGLHDVVGNVWEWVEDTYHKNAMGAPEDGAAWVDGIMGRVQRGGSWRRAVDSGRVSARTWQDEAYFADDLGFRCVVSGRTPLDDYALVLNAEIMYPLIPQPEDVFSSAALDVADRRYLERRAVTWLVLEGRASEGLPFVAKMLQREQEDPAALDLLARVEADLDELAQAGAVVEMERSLAAFRTVVRSNSTLRRRLAPLEASLAQRLMKQGASLSAEQDYRAAAACVTAAKRLIPEDFEVVRLARVIEPVAGAHRLWPRDGREVVWIPGGSFSLGASAGDRDAEADEHPALTVRIEGFWLDRAEVTQAEYRLCVEDGSCTPPEPLSRYADASLAGHPVVSVDWFQARAFCRWADKRLPTEAERERAARQGTAARFPWGVAWAPGKANTNGVEGNDRWSDTAPVGSFGPEDWGLLDMMGNVWEWVADAYHRDYRGAPRDGRAWHQVNGDMSPPRRVLRGGSYLSPPFEARVSKRDHRAPENSARNVGFRCAADG